jgi:hypothetical protein
MMNKQAIALFALPALSLAIASWVWLEKQPQENNACLLAEAKDCQLHQQACHIIDQRKDQNLDISLEINPKPIPIAKALTITAKMTGITPQRVQLDINGTNMYMGYNRIDLTPQADGSWTGKTLLAFCTIDQMSWQLTLMMDTESGEQIQAPFSLITPY